MSDEGKTNRGRDEEARDPDRPAGTGLGPREDEAVPEPAPTPEPEPSPEPEPAPTDDTGAAPV